MSKEAQGLGAPKTTDATDATDVAVVPVAPWGETLSRRRVVLVLVSIMLGMLLGALDQTVVGTAMPRVIADLNGLQHYAWVTTAYLIASAVSMPIWGKLSDSFGRRRFYMAGMVLFVIGSALCGQSRSMAELIAFRAVQGLGGGAMMSINQAIVGDIFPPATRAKWQGMMMGVFGFATIGGPVLGGWITDTMGWRWTFYVNLPIGAIALAFALVAIPKHVRLHKCVIDYVGAALIMAAAVPLLITLSFAGSTLAWSSPVVIGLFVFSAVMWVVLYFWERQTQEPMINPRLFRNSIYSVSVISSTLFSAVMFGTPVFLPLFVQGVMGQTATGSGTILMPMLLTQIVVGMAWGWLLSKWGRYKAVLLGGYATMALSAYLLSGLTAASSHQALYGFMILMGLGLGLTIKIPMVVAQNQYPTYRLGEVSSTLMFCRSLGGTMGLAVFGSILNSRFASSLSATLPDQLRSLASDPATATQLDNPQALLSENAEAELGKLFSRFGDDAPGLLTAFKDAVRHSLESALSQVFLLAMALMIVATLVSVFLKEVPLHRTHSEVVETRTS